VAATTNPSRVRSVDEAESYRQTVRIVNVDYQIPPGKVVTQAPTKRNNAMEISFLAENV